MMKLTAQMLVLTMVTAPIARAADAPLPPPPPPPNPFSNLPAGGSEGFTPFDDDFDDFNGGTGPKAEGAKGAAGEKASGGSGGTQFVGGGALKAEGGHDTRLAPPATCKMTVESFDYPDSEILDVAKAIGKLTGRNFIYNPQDVKGKISIVSQTEITVCDAWNAFLTGLNVRGFALVPSGKYLRIERIANAKEKQTPIYSEKKIPNNDEFITRVVPLRYIDATEFESAFRLWMPREARMQAYQQTNTIIITDTATHINRMIELISLLDVAGYQESLVVVPIHNAAAKDIAKLIENILREGAANNNPFGGFGGNARPANPYGAPTRTGTKGRSGGSTISKIIADDRTNALIVKANAAGIQEIRALVRRLDTKVAAAEGSGRIHVVSLRFANADELGKVLQTLVGGAGGSRNSSRGAFPAFGEAPPTFQSEIKVASDKTTQSLVITASPQDFVTMKKVIERLDQPRDQVYLEAMILEMGINRDSAFGTSAFNAVNGLGLDSASGNLQKVLFGGVPTGFVLGFKLGDHHTITGPDGKDHDVKSTTGLLDLVQANGDAQVLATPQIIALDNEKATFEVSEQVPVQQATVNQGVTTITTSSDKATLSLEVTPQINKGSNFVKLEIKQRMEQFDNTQVPKELLGKANGKNTRATETKVFVQSDDTVVLSGMIRNTVLENINKVPLLGDIPVLGWLFKNSNKTNRKTNLLVFITPHIIKQYDKIRRILADKLNERDDFVRESMGSIDPYGREVNKLKKNLPDLTVIEPLPSAKPLDSSTFQGPSSPDRDDEEGGGQNGFDQGYYDPYANGYSPLPEIPPVPPPQLGNEGFVPPPEGAPPPVAIPTNPMDGGGMPVQ
jgi:general secretion pathway protein D